MREQTPRELLVIILDDRERLPAVLAGLYEAGVPGATVLDSVGGHRSHSWLEEIGLPGVARMFHVNELQQRTIFAVMESDLIPAAIAAAEQAVGGFGRPDSGMLFTMPVSHTVGLQKRVQPEEDISEPFVSAGDILMREMPVGEAARLISGDDVVVSSQASLAEVARALLSRPSTHVAAVISREEHLLGLVTLRGLADAVFFGIMPEMFFGEVHDREQAEAFGRLTNVHTAADFMIPPVSVHLDDPISEAFRLMHANDLSGLPIVDDESRVVDFVTLLELLQLVMERGGGDKPS